MKRSKRALRAALHCLLALCLLSSSLAVFAAQPEAPWEGGGSVSLEQGQTCTVQVNYNTAHYFSFTAPESGSYTLLKSMASPFTGDTADERFSFAGIRLYDSAGTLLECSDNWDGYQIMTFELQKGKSYYFGIGTFNGYVDEDSDSVFPMDVLIVPGTADDLNIWWDGGRTVINEGSCTELRITSLECTELGFRYYEDGRPRHAFVTKTEVEPTCAEYGSGTNTCSLCGYSEPAIIDIKAHFDSDFDGICDDCGEKMEIETLPDADTEEDEEKTVNVYLDTPNRPFAYFLFVPSATRHYEVSELWAQGDKCVLRIYDTQKKAYLEDDGNGEFDLTKGVKYAVVCSAAEGVDSRMTLCVTVRHWHIYDYEHPVEVSSSGSCVEPRVTVYACPCGKTQSKSEYLWHIDNDGDDKCDVCGRLLPEAEADKPFNIGFVRDNRYPGDLAIIFRPEKDGVYVLEGEYLMEYNVYTEADGDADLVLTPEIYRAGKTYYLIPFHTGFKDLDEGNPSLIKSQLAPWEAETWEEIAVGTKVAETESRQHKFYRFIPTESGEYTLTGDSERMFEMFLYDADGAEMDCNFKEKGVSKDVKGMLKSGKTYYFDVFLYSRDAGSVSLKLEKTGDAPEEPPVAPKEGAVARLDGETGNITVTDSDVSAFLDKFDNIEDATVVDKFGRALDADDRIGTGAVVTVGDQSYTVVVKGDVNGDGLVQAKDARTALRASASLDDLNGVFFDAANVLESEDLTAGSARKILRYSASLEQSLF